MMWGMTLHPGVEYTREITRQEYITLAALDCRQQMNKGDPNLTAHLVLKCDGYEHVICTLQQGIVHQQILNFVLHKRENLTLRVEGTGIIHVTGYSMEHPVLSDGVTSTTNTIVKREVHDGTQDGEGHSSHPSSDGYQSTIVDEDSSSEIKSESQYIRDLETDETEEGFYQQLNDESNVLTDSLTGSAIYNNDTITNSVTVNAIYNNDSGCDSVTVGDIQNTCTGSELVETSNINMDTNDHRGSTSEAVSTNTIVEDAYNCLPNVKVELEEETDQNLNSRNVLQTNEETGGAIASYETISSATESSTNVMDSKGHRQSICENTSSSGNVTQGTGSCTSHANADTEQGSDQHLDSSNDLLTSSRTESVFDSSENTHATMESSTLEMDRNDHCWYPDDKNEGTCMDRSFSDEAILEGSNGNIIEGSVSYMKKEEMQASCELFEGNVGSEVNLETVVRSNVLLDDSPHQACLKTKCCTVLLKNIKQSYGNHPLCHSSRESFKCQFCDEIFNEKVVWAMHEKNHTVEQTFPTQSFVRVLNDRQLFKCEVCTKEFNAMDDLNSHRSIYLCKNNFICGKCGKKFDHMAHLKVHERIHTDMKASKGNDCLKKFNHRTVLTLQENRHTDSNLFSCKFCEKKFCQKAELQQHQGTHSGDKTFTCKDCGKTYFSKQILQRHERIHTGERPFKCKYCDKKFSWKAVAKQHETIHTGEKPFTCKYCHKKFSRKATVIQHERIHTGEKPFSCKYCDKKFGQKGTLKQHERSHTGERPFSYKHIDKKFSQSTHQK